MVTRTVPLAGELLTGASSKPLMDVPYSKMAAELFDTMLNQATMHISAKGMDLFIKYPVLKGRRTQMSHYDSYGADSGAITLIAKS